MEYANGRLHMTEDDVSNFGASFCTAMKAMSDNVAELLNVLSATKDSDDLDVDDIAMSGRLTITDAHASAIACGLAGATNPALKVDSATASSTTGVSIKSAAGDGGAFIAAISDKTNEQLNIDSKGSDALVLQGTATGGITLSREVTFSVDSILSDGVDLEVGSTNGSKIGTATSQRIGFFNQTPAEQQTHVAEVETTGATSTDPHGFTEAQANAVIALVNGCRTALVNLGLMAAS